MASGVASKHSLTTDSALKGRPALRSTLINGPERKAVLEASRADLVATYLGDTLRKSRHRRKEKAGTCFLVEERKCEPRGTERRVSMYAAQSQEDNQLIRRASILSPRDAIPELALPQQAGGDTDACAVEGFTGTFGVQGPPRKSFLPEISVEGGMTSNFPGVSRKDSTVSMVSGGSAHAFESRRGSQVRLMVDTGATRIARRNTGSLTLTDNDLAAIHELHGGLITSKRGSFAASKSGSRRASFGPSPMPMAEGDNQTARALQRMARRKVR